jgi:hypothetical protein
MYPAADEEEVAPSMAGGASEVAGGRPRPTLKKKKLGVSAEARKEVARFNQAFEGLWLPKVRTLAEAIRKANFAKMANGELLTRYLDTAEAAAKLTLLSEYALVYFTTPQQIEDLNNDREAYLGLLYFIFNAQVIEAAALTKCTKHTQEYDGHDKAGVQLAFFVKKLITPKVDIPDVVDVTNNLYGMMKLFYAHTNKVIQMLKRTYGKAGFVHSADGESLKTEKLSKDYTMLL